MEMTKHPQHPHHTEGFCTLATCDYSKALLARIQGKVYPRIDEQGRTLWACCDSTIGPACGHLSSN